MMVWEDFEVKCTDYLNTNFGNVAKFYRLGQSDSTVSDIRVITNTGKQFYIEAKLSPAQCGQFVLLPNFSARSFEYSKLNITPINQYSQQIIQYMNQYFDEFAQAGTSGKDIDISNRTEIFANWIIKFYKDKNVKYIITNNYIVLPVDRLPDYFNIKAKYRVKRSGSSSVGKNNISILTDYIINNFAIEKIEVDIDKMFVSSPSQLHNKRFVVNEVEYMFSKRGEKFEVRKLSNTFNANVIFSIELKENMKGLDFSEFIAILVSD